MGTRAAGECFHSFFEFSQIITSEEKDEEKEKQLVYFDHQTVNSLCSRHHYINILYFYRVIEHGFKPISVRICFGLFSNVS